MTTNTSDGIVITNNSTVKTNEGTVTANSETGTVETNNGTVTKNEGTVKTNTVDGTVTNSNNGAVEENYGTVIESDGSIKFGVLFRNSNGKGGSKLMQLTGNAVAGLSKLFKYRGHKIKGYEIQAAAAEASKTVASAEYTAKAPGTVILLWKKNARVKPYNVGGFSDGAIQLIHNAASKAVISAEEVSLARLFIDGEELTGNDFTVELDSLTKDIEITFSAAFLSSLSTGSHTVSIRLLKDVYTVTATV